MATVHVLVKEHQEHYGFIETDVIGVYVRRGDAIQDMARDKALARYAGLRTCGDEDGDDDGDWQVHWRIEERQLSEPAQIVESQPASPKGPRLPDPKNDVARA